MSSRWRTSASPYRSWTIAFIASSILRHARPHGARRATAWHASPPAAWGTVSAARRRYEAHAQLIQAQQVEGVDVELRLGTSVRPPDLPRRCVSRSDREPRLAPGLLAVQVVQLDGR